MESFEVTLFPKQPFDFRQSLSFLESFRADGISRKIEGNQVSFALSLKGQPIFVRLEPVKNQLKCSLSARQLDKALVQEALEHIRFYLSLEDDLSPFYAKANQDDAFKPVLKTLYGYHQVKYPSVFCCACWALITQRTPNSFAYKTMERLCEYLGKTIEIAGETYYCFPEAKDFLQKDARQAVLRASNNIRKTERLMKIAEAFALVDLNFFKNASYEVLYKWLKNIHGLGAWSVDYIMLRGLGRRERSPWTDTEIIQAISDVYTSGLSISLGDAKKLAESYGWDQGYWVHYLKVARALKSS